MPVVGSRDRDGVDRFIFKQLPNILEAYRLLTRFLFYGGQTALEHVVVCIAQRNQLNIGLLQVVVDVVHTPAVEPDDGNMDLIVGANSPSRLRDASLGLQPDRRHTGSGRDKRLLQET